MLELRHLKTLTALREHGSLVAAAGDLCLTPSALSHQLRELDQWFGVGSGESSLTSCEFF